MCIFLESMTPFKDAITESQHGVLIHLHVIPGSSQTDFPGSYNQWRKCFEIKVRSEAKDNKANSEILQTVARFFQVSPRDVLLVSGEKHREKTVCVKKISVDAVTAKLKESFHG
jgi:uncharacterized protein (TIGR00251 family)